MPLAFLALAASSLLAFLSPKPSLIAPVTLLIIALMDFEASSFGGIGKSIFLGSLLVSTIAKLGLFTLFASLTAISSSVVSITKSAGGKRVIFDIEPEFFAS